MATELQLSSEHRNELFRILKDRFDKNMHRHPDLQWSEVQTRLEANPKKLWSLDLMEETGGEPDVVGYDKSTDNYLIFDCADESPKNRRSLCYDDEALESRKLHKPKDSAVNMAKSMGLELLSEAQYRDLQKLGAVDTKTSSWIKTPSHIRKLGGAIFGDFRFDTIFIYHNGAESYYAARGFRSVLKV